MHALEAFTVSILAPALHATNTLRFGLLLQLLLVLLCDSFATLTSDEKSHIVYLSPALLNVPQAGRGIANRVTHEWSSQALHDAAVDLAGEIFGRFPLVDDLTTTGLPSVEVDIFTMSQHEICWLMSPPSMPKKPPCQGLLLGCFRRQGAAMAAGLAVAFRLQRHPPG